MKRNEPSIDINAVEGRIDYRFRDAALLRLAFVRSSYANEHGTQSNERLEFLGNSVLDLIIAEELYSSMPHLEGELTKRKAEIVSNESLSNAVTFLEIEDYMLCGAGTAHSEKSTKVRADLYEAIVAAIYLDGGISAAKKFVAHTLNATKPVKDYKSCLQEHIQGMGEGLRIEYVTVDRAGTPNAPVFTEAVLIGGKEYARGIGSSRKEAQQEAAGKALTIFADAVKRQQKAISRNTAE